MNINQMYLYVKKKNFVRNDKALSIHSIIGY